MTIRITRVDTSSRKDVNRFVQMPFGLYRDCPQWVPPLVDDVKLQMNRRKYPFYEHSDAEFFLAERNGSVVGRIAILENRPFNAHWHSQTAFFYFFDAEDDTEAACALLSAAEEWARARGMNRVVGAKGFLQGDGMGILVDGFEHHPAVGIPYNHPYYGNLLEASGYTRQRDFYSAYIPGKIQLPPRIFEIAERMKERRGFTIKSFRSKAELRAMVPEIVRTYNETFVRNWEFAPVTEAEAKVIGDRLLAIADPKLIKLVMKGDDIAGFLFGFQDISEGIRRARGRFWPFGWFWLLRDFRQTKWLNLNGAGILAPYRGLGVNAILYAEMQKSLQEGNFEHADITQMEESVLTLDDATNLGGKVYKVHRIYEKSL